MTTRPALRAIVPTYALLLLGAAEAWSQFNRPGSGLTAPSTRTLVTLVGDAEEALWHVGAFRVTPRIGLQDLRYDSNAQSPTSDEEGDATATLAAGFDAYLPVGPHSIFEFTVLPAYVYWARFSEQNRLLGTYRAGFLSDFNRLQFNFEAEKREELGLQTSEVFQRLPSDQVVFSGGIEVDLTRQLAIRVSGRGTRTRLDEPESGFEPGLDSLRRLDRDELAVRAGLAWKPRERTRIEAGMQNEENDFLNASRSNEGDSPYLLLQVEGGRLTLYLDATQRSLEAKQGESFETVDEVTGRYRVSLAPGWRILYMVYGQREISYSFDTTQSHIEDDRLGLALSVELSDRAKLDLWSENGELRYVPLAAAEGLPTEDLTAYGLGLSFEVSDRARLRIGGGHVELSAPGTGVPREWDYFSGGLAVTFSRVRVEVGSGI